MEAVEDIPGAAMHEGHPVGVGELSGVHGRPRAASSRDRLRRAGSPLRAASASRDGRGAASRNEEAYARGRVAHGGARPARASARARLGFSTSRTELHNNAGGRPRARNVPRRRDEIFGIGRALADCGSGVFQDGGDAPRGARRARLDGGARARNTGAWSRFNLQQIDARAPTSTRRACAGSTPAATRDLHNLRAQFAGRPVGVLMGWETTVHPFLGHPAYVGGGASAPR